MMKTRLNRKRPRSRTFAGVRRGLAPGFLLALAIPATSATALEVRGRVVDEGGAPIAGARVELQRLPARYEIGLRIASGVLRAEAAGEVRTSGDGGYALAVPEPGMWQVEAAAPGKIPRRYRLVPLLTSRDLPDATLRDDGGAWIAVVDAAGAPVAGAQVWMRVVEPRDRRRPADGAAWQERGRFTTTDGAGNAYLARYRGEPLEVSAFAPGFAPATAVEVAGDRGRVVLERGWATAVRLVDAAGEPLRRVVVGVGRLQWVAGQTDAQGRVTVHPASKSPLTLALHLPTGQHEVRRLEPAADDSAAAEEEPRRLELPPPAVFEGRVLDGASRRSVPGAWVWSESDPGRVAVADRGGAYRLVEGAAGGFQVGAAAPGYQVTRTRLSEAEGLVDRSLALWPAAELAGRVLDRAGVGVAGAEIEAWREGRQQLRSPGENRTKANGSGVFRLTDLARDTEYELRVTAPGFAPALVSARTRGEDELEITLEPGRVLIGRLVDEGGEPISGGSVFVTAGPARWMTMSGARPSEPPSTASAADGTFRLDGLRPQPAVLVARKPGFAPKQVPVFDLGSADEAVAAGEEVGVVDLGDLVLVPGAEIRGLVRDRDGEGIAGAAVYIVGSSVNALTLVGFGPAGEQERQRTTDAEGRFHLFGLVPGDRLALVVDHSEYLRHSEEGLEAGVRETVEIVLDRAARVSGRVENERREPVAEVLVEVRPLTSSRGELTGPFADATQRDSTYTGADGTFTLERVPAGRVELQAAGGGHAPGETLELSLARGEHREGVVLRVRPGVVLLGTVRDAAGRPVPGVILQVDEKQRAGSGMMSLGAASAQSDTDGRYRLAGLDPASSRLLLSAHHPDFLMVERELALEAGDNYLDVVLERGVRVSGVVLGPRGDAVPGAAVGLDSGAGVYFSGRDTSITSSDGRFEIDGVGPGIYHAFAIKEGYARTALPDPIEVGRGPVEGLTIYLSRGGTIRGRVIGLEPEELTSVAIFASNESGQSAAGVVGEDGEYRVQSVGFGSGVVSAMSRSTGQHVSEVFDLDTEGGETWVDLEFSRRRGSRLSGRVDLDGEPWRGVQVVAQGGVESQGAATTDAGGAFEINGLRDGRHQLVLFGGVAISHSEAVEVRGDTEVTISISTVRVSGQVLAANTGEPVARAEVVAESESPVWLASMAPRSTTSAGGRFELVLPAERRVTLWAKAAGRSAAELTIETGSGPAIEGLELVLGDGSELVLDVRLAGGLMPSWVSAAVVDASGRRLAAELIGAVTRMPVRVGSVPPGDWTLLVAGQGGALVRRPVTVPGPPVAVTLPPEARVTVLLGAAELEIGGVTMRVLTAAGEPLLVPTYGRLLDVWPVLSPQTVIPSLPGGAWVVEVRDAAGNVLRRPVTAVPGETVTVRFD